MKQAAYQLVVVLAVLLVPVWCVAEETVPLTPDQLAGLEAWYDAGTTFGGKRTGGEVNEWKDISGNEHHLIDNRNGLAAQYRTKQINHKPAVVIGVANSHSVTSPFEMDDYTIFLIYRVDGQKHALFSSDQNNRIGVVLRHSGGFDSFNIGGSAASSEAHFNKNYSAPERFSITVLARENGMLHSFINGRDLSAGAKNEEIMRVGKFFSINLSKFVKLDGHGLRIGEMIFYDRYLTGDERNGLTDQLSSKYGIEVDLQVEPEIKQAPFEIPVKDTVQVWLSTASPGNVNTLGSIPWDLQQKLEGPFSHDPASIDSASLYHTGEGSNVRVTVAMTLTTTDPDTNVRIMVLKNDQDYQPQDASSGVIATGAEAEGVKIQLQLTLRLEKDDSIRVITLKEGAEGQVTIQPGSAFLSVEVLQ
jgi:hypothetical protein